MRIVIDARMYGPARWTGIGRYLQNLLKELEQLDQKHEYVVLLGKENFDEYQPTAKNFRKELADFPIYSLAEQILLPLHIARLRPDLVHFPSPNAPVLYFGRRVTTVHDLTLLFHDTNRHTGWRGQVTRLKRLAFRFVLWWNAHHSAQLFTPTHYVKRQLVDHYHLGPGKVSVTPLAVNLPENQDHQADLSRFALGDQYILYVGNCYPYKNVGRLVQAMAWLAPERPNLKLALVGRDDHFRQALRELAAQLNLTDAIVFTGAVTDAELATLYRQASVYAYPSISEGFGLQGLEAMAHDLPVVAADASCLPETCGEAAVYFDPYDAAQLAVKVAGVLDDPELRKQMVAEGRHHLKKFSWHETARETQAVYERVLKS